MFKNLYDIQEWNTDLILGDLCKNGYQLRPHIVWFGEDVPMIPKAISICERADILLIIGTSMQVYPAASLMHYVSSETKKYYIDPKPAIENDLNLTVISKSATEGINTFKDLILQ